MKVIGIDLAGKESNPTGLCILSPEKTETLEIFSDMKIFEKVEIERLDLIAIGAPFGFPTSGWYGDSDRKLMEIGLKPLPPKFPGMKHLVFRAMRIVKALRSQGFNVIEVFPRATEKILKTEGKKSHCYDARKERRPDQLVKVVYRVCALTGKLY
ncbi:MAG: DUF429 domain-containing protein [Candidatus Aenigmatarchaeota archaeon]